MGPNYGAALFFGVWRSNGASSSRVIAPSAATPATPAAVYAEKAGKWLIARASKPETAPSAYRTRTALRWPLKRFERRCAAWSFPGVVKGIKPRREREMEISVVSKIVAPRMKIGTSHAALEPAAIMVLTRICPLANAKMAKKSDATAAIPAQSPSMWSRMLKDAVMPTTHTKVRAVSAQMQAVAGQYREKTCARMPVASRITAAAGMAPNNLIW